MLTQEIKIQRVTVGTVLKDPPNRFFGIAARAAETHSGHWNPTGALIMQSGQIFRSHRPHETYASLSV
jgi:hypothetical protein